MRAAAVDGRLDEICEEYGVVVMSAFGSAAGSHKPDPDDLDLGVHFERGMDPMLRARRQLALWEALADLTGYEGIDVVCLDVDNPVLRVEALNGIPIYERSADVYAEARLAALGEFRDTAHLRRRSLELMAT